MCLLLWIKCYGVFFFFFSKVYLNDVELKLTKKEKLPKLVPISLPASNGLLLPKLTLVFYVFPDAQADACL